MLIKDNNVKQPLKGKNNRAKKTFQECSRGNVCLQNQAIEKAA